MRAAPEGSAELASEVELGQIEIQGDFVGADTLSGLGRGTDTLAGDHHPLGGGPGDRRGNRHNEARQRGKAARRPRHGREGGGPRLDTGGS